MMANTNKNSVNPEQLLNFGKIKRLPVILQTELAECGLACVGMIAGYHGFDIDIASLRTKFSISAKGANLKSIMDIAVKMNFSPRAIRAELDDLCQVQLPCIVHWGLNHFVVLKLVCKNKMIVHDPAIGERIISRRDFGNEFSGVIIELSPTKLFKKGDEQKNLSLGHFWSSIVGLKRSLAHIFLLSLLLQVFALAAPFYMQTVVDDVLLRKDVNLLVILSLGFFLLIFIQVGTKVLREIMILQISNRLGMQISANLFRHLIHLPVDYFSKRHMGDIVSRFSSLGAIRELLSHGVVSALIDGIMALATLIAMFFYSIKLALIVVVVVTLYAFSRWAFYSPFRLLMEESLVASAKENSHFMESLRSIQTIKIFQRESDRQHQWLNRLAGTMNKNIQIANWRIRYDTINDVLFGIENILVIYFAASAVMGNVLSLGMLYAFMSYKGHFIASMVNLINQWIDLKMLDVHLNRLADIAFTNVENISDYAQDIKGNDHQRNLSISPHMNSFSEKKINGKIEVRGLAYRYSEHDPYVFKNLNFIIQPGESVAITGPSGCGKTTLLKCLMGLLSPSEGEIYIDDELVKNISQFRRQIAGVMQDDHLFSGDIAENISCFSDVLDMKKIQYCAKLACIHDEIINMSMQYHSPVGDMGTSLSGGQKQRIILARALYREPRILFMDEATSHLDIDNELVVNNHIQQLNITRVLIAHRPETVKSAGRQINLETPSSN